MDIHEMVNGNIVCAPQKKAFDYFINNADKSVNKSAIVLTNISENNHILDQGFETQYRTKTDFVYQITVLSKFGTNQDYCEHIVNKIRNLIDNHTTKLSFTSNEGAPIYLVQEPESTVADLWQGVIKVVGSGFIKTV